ncbi:hypothetical protein ACL9RF_08885 [Sphingobacterium sp. Mn56C]|uniref:hypothetical protein n=1 Tax=Sphingobacterium sp. Mn56C TaxID=3395261 RepID=UPI003BDA9741
MIRLLFKTAFLVLPLFFVFSTGKAQVSEAPKVSGLVLEKSTGIRLGDVNIVNLRTNRKVTSNIYGVFYIEATPGDSLSLSKIGYGPLKTVLYSMDDILLEMQPGLQIETVVVARRTRQQEMDDILRDYSKKGVYNGGHNKVTTYIASPATALYNLFGKEAKNMKRFEKYMDREVDEIAVDKIFTRQVVAESTGLEGQELQNFMLMYRPSYAVARNWGRYDVLNYINRSFRAWDKQGRPAPVELPKLEIPEQN